MVDSDKIVDSKREVDSDEITEIISIFDLKGK